MRSAEPAHAVCQLDREASMLLDVLVEAGHLDEKSLEKVNDRLLDLSPESGIITGQQLRGIAAEVLFDAMEELPDEIRRAMEQEWPLLFH